MNKFIDEKNDNINDIKSSENNIIISKESPFCSDAIALMDELSGILKAITGSSGRASFDSNDVCVDGSIFVIARSHEGKAIGCGSLRPMNEKTAEIKRMYVRKKSSGIGSKILAYLENSAEEMGYDKLRLETRIVNSKAVSFYRKEGYYKIDNYGKYVNNEKSICFEKFLYKFI
jgi:N-acetylglutamate synthase-like GNAT family acetyltransferase